MSFLDQPLQLFSIAPQRSFGGGIFGTLGGDQGYITGYVTISESTTDSITITRHPLQQGAAVADHAFKNPTTLSIQMQHQHNFGQSLKDIYDSLLALQSLFFPFDVVTPKRTYHNMLLTSIGVTTDKRTENLLAVNASFEEIIIVPVKTAVVPPSKQKSPGKTGGTQVGGSKSLIEQSFESGKNALGILSGGAA